MAVAATLLLPRLGSWPSFELGLEFDFVIELGTGSENLGLGWYRLGNTLK